jgi:hypothetical protein
MMGHDAISDDFLAAISPWRSTHFGDQSEIEAQIRATGTWETLAAVRSLPGLDAEDLASFIVMVVNEYAARCCQRQDHANTKRAPARGRTQT